MREDKAFDPSCTGRQRVADHRRRDVLERAIALLQPPSEEAMETWPLKRLRRAPETFVGGPDARVWHRPQLPEVPRQFLNRTVSVRSSHVSMSQVPERCSFLPDVGPGG